MALIAEKEHANRGLGGSDLHRGRREHRHQQADPGPIHDDRLHSGSFWIAPPCMALSWASRPVQVQFALWRAFG
jgi:hypothetical protein